MPLPAPPTWVESGTRRYKSWLAEPEAAQAITAQRRGGGGPI